MRNESSVPIKKVQSLIGMFSVGSGCGVSEKGKE